MPKSLRKPHKARTARGWLIAAAGFAPALAGAVAPVRAADDDPYAKAQSLALPPGRVRPLRRARGRDGCARRRLAWNADF